MQRLLNILHLHPIITCFNIDDNIFPVLPAMLLRYAQDQEIESLAAIESELEDAAQKLRELRRG